MIILLTDGVNNSGFVDPMTAVEAALEYGIRVYTIGVGKNGMAPFKMQDFFGNTRFINRKFGRWKIFEKEVAETTGGKIFPGHEQ
ncbi:MAG: VWA domain-containing protein [Bacteroidia bacterium]